MDFDCLMARFVHMQNIAKQRGGGRLAVGSRGMGTVRMPDRSRSQRYLVNLGWGSLKSRTLEKEACLHMCEGVKACVVHASGQ